MPVFIHELNMYLCFTHALYYLEYLLVLYLVSELCDDWTDNSGSDSNSVLALNVTLK